MLRVCLAVFDPPGRAFNTAKTEEVSGLAGPKKKYDHGAIPARLLECVSAWSRL